MIEQNYQIFAWKNIVNGEQKWSYTGFDDETYLFGTIYSTYTKPLIHQDKSMQLQITWKQTFSKNFHTILVCWEAFSSCCWFKICYLCIGLSWITNISRIKNEWTFLLNVLWAVFHVQQRKNIAGIITYSCYFNILLSCKSLITQR